MKFFRMLPFILALALAACGRETLPRFNLGAPPQVLADHVSGLVAEATEVGPVDAAQTMDLRLQLPISNQDDLDNLLANIYNPNSTEYHQYLTPSAFTERFYPSADAIKDLRAALADAGFTTAAAPQGGFLAATASAHATERFFNTQINNYVAADGTPFYSPDGSVSVPDGLPIVGVYGLHNGPPQRNYAQVANAGPIGSNAAIQQLQLNPNDIRNAYNIPATARGAGQTIAIVELDGFLMTDFTKYTTMFNLPAVPIETKLLDNYSGAAGSGQVEVDLDLDVAIALAPDLAGITLIEAPNSLQGFLDVFNECANPTTGSKTLPAVVSCSWGSAETANSLANVQSFNTLFQQLAAQGQTAFIASGDSGARADGTTVGVQNPSSQPWAVGVGGTTLEANLAQTTGVYQLETTWSGSGGGISSFWPIPSWQVPAMTTAAKGSTTMRNVPDVSLDADPNTGYIIVSGGKSGIVGGTSAAAPLWTAFIALVNAQRASQGLEPMGFLGPVFYSLGTGPNYGKNFHDIADNSSNGVYPAVTGFDDSTGWGSFQGAALLQTLSSGYARRGFNAPAGLQ